MVLHADTAGAANNAVHFVILIEHELRQVSTVLPGYPGYKRAFPYLKSTRVAYAGPAPGRFQRYFSNTYTSLAAPSVVCR